MPATPRDTGCDRTAYPNTHPEIVGNDRYSLPPQLFYGGGKEIFCSPWCGGKCTKAAHDAAIEAADALAARMGEGWEPLVWENLAAVGEQG